MKREQIVDICMERHRQVQDRGGAAITILLCLSCHVLAMWQLQLLRITCHWTDDSLLSADGS